MSRFNRFPLHPLLFAFFPVFSLFVQNSEQLPILEWLRPALFVAGLVLLLWFALNRWIHNLHMSAIIISILAVLFFSYGRVIDALTYEIYELQALRPLAFLVEGELARTAWLGLFMLLFIAALFLLRSAGHIQVINEVLNVSAVALVLIAGANWALASFKEMPAFAYAASWEKEMSSKVQPNEVSAPHRRAPDVYYIILDGYGREDILNAIYQVDNSSFYSFLRTKGFYVADASHSNYDQTHLSLASSLNSTYLDELESEVGEQAASKSPLGAMIEDSVLFRQVRANGAKVITFSTGLPFADVKSGDLYLSAPGTYNSFDNALLNTTPLPLFLNLPFFESQYQSQRDRILYSLDHLGEVASIPGPKLVFCHVLAPHPPFVFDANGGPVQPDLSFDLLDGSSFTSRSSEAEYVRGYRNQLVFVTGRVREAIEQILDKSANPPIIIIQGDHGPGSMLDWLSATNTYLPERFSILNAYYFPDHDYSKLYPSITPVNSFRVVLDQYFGANYPLLEDHSYFSPGPHPYSFTDVTSQLTPNTHR